MPAAIAISRLPQTLSLLARQPCGRRSLAISVMTKAPMPQACLRRPAPNRCRPSPVPDADQQHQGHEGGPWPAPQTAVITPAISTGNASSAVKFSGCGLSIKCSAENTSRSTPMVSTHCRRRSRASGASGSCAESPSSQSEMACGVHHAHQHQRQRGLAPSIDMAQGASTSAAPSAALAVTYARNTRCRAVPSPRNDAPGLASREATVADRRAPPPSSANAGSSWGLAGWPHPRIGQRAEPGISPRAAAAGAGRPASIATTSLVAGRRGHRADLGPERRWASLHQYTLAPSITASEAGRCTPQCAQRAMDCGLRADGAAPHRWPRPVSSGPWR